MAEKVLVTNNHTNEQIEVEKVGNISDLKKIISEKIYLDVCNKRNIDLSYQKEHFKDNKNDKNEIFAIDIANENVFDELFNSMSDNCPVESKSSELNVKSEESFKSSADLSDVAISVDEIFHNTVILCNGKKIGDRVPLSVLGPKSKLIFTFRKVVKDRLTIKRQSCCTANDSDPFEVENYKENIENQSKNRKTAGVRQRIEFFEESIKQIHKEIDPSDLSDNRELLIFPERNLLEPSFNTSSTQIVAEHEKIVRNLETGEKMIIDKSKIVKRGNKLYYLRERPQIAQTNDAFTRYAQISRQARENLIQKIQQIAMQLSFDLIIKTSMIIALFYSGNYPMACVLLLMSSLSFLSTRSFINGGEVDSMNVFYKIIDIGWSFFASMFIISYDVPVY